jgi:23S rRNA (adenine2030-N6)-methyltransferase
MNYRHIYHAGNFADVLKHATLTLCLDYLQQKESPLCVIDSHAGLGLYDLNSVQAQKTKEYERGIGRFISIPTTSMPADFALYWNHVKGDVRHGCYAGSPLIAARMLRPQDRLIANELHPEDSPVLAQHLKGFAGAQVRCMDAYECLRANLPPPDKRGLILIDPPFEQKDEFALLTRQMKEWKKRFANGVYLLWYPIKTHLAVESLKQAARDLNLPRTWVVEGFQSPPDTPDSFNGAGVIVFNAPYQIPERAFGLRPFLLQSMELHSINFEWLTAP